MSTQCLTADAELNFHCFDTDAYMDGSSLVEDRFATMPVLAVSPLTQPLSEEELHTSFEQAISDRLMIVNQRLSRASGPLTYTYPQRSQMHTEPLGDINAMNSAVYPPVPEQQHHAAPGKGDWRRLSPIAALP